MKNRALSFCCAILLTVAAYLLWTSLFRENTLLFWITTVALFTVTLVIGLLFGAKLNVFACGAFVCGVVYSTYPWINGLHFGSLFLYAHALLLTYAIFILSLFGNHNRYLRTGTFLLDAFKAVFVYPFVSFIAYFKALFHWNSGSKKVGLKILFTLIGVAAALILGLITIALLSFDPRFAEMIRLHFSLKDVPEFIFKLILSVPVAALLFSAFRSSQLHKLQGFSSEERADRIGTGMKKIPTIVFLIPSVTLLFIYGLFFVSQWEFYTSAFSGVLPEEYTAAAYARKGFFELCAVASISAALCTAIRVFTRRSGKALSVLVRITNTLLALATLVLIAMALSKLALYIRRFDLTYTRFLAAIVLFLFAVGFLMLILSQWIKRVQVMPVLIVCVTALLLAAPFCNVRGRIAAYNVDRYLDRAEESEADNRIDLYYLIDDLGDAGIPEAVRLLESGKLDADDDANLRQLLEMRYSHLKELDDARHTLASRHALKSLETFFDH